MDYKLLAIKLSEAARAASSDVLNMCIDNDEGARVLLFSIDALREIPGEMSYKAHTTLNTEYIHEYSKMHDGVKFYTYEAELCTE